MAKQILNDNVSFGEQREKINDNFEEVYSFNLQKITEEGGATSESISIQVDSIPVRNKIVFLGDSIIEGYLIDPIENRYTTRLCHKLGYVEDNRGVGGSSVKNTPLSIIPTKSSDMAFLWIAFGTNDRAISGNTASLFKNDLTNFVNNALTKGWSANDIYLATVPGYQYGDGNSNSAIQPYNIATEEVATEKGCAFVDMYNVMVNGRPFGSLRTLFLTPDHVHPNSTVGSEALSIIAGSYFPAIQNLTDQSLVVGGVTESVEFLLRNYVYEKTGKLIGVDEDGNIYPLLGIPDSTVALGDLLLSKGMKQVDAVSPSIFNDLLDLLLKQGTKILSSNDEINFAYLQLFSPDGDTIIYNAFRNLIFKIKRLSDGVDFDAFGIKKDRLELNFRQKTFNGYDAYYEQYSSETVYGRFWAFDTSGHTVLRNSFTSGTLKVQMANDTDGSIVEMLRMYANGRTQFGNGANVGFADIPSARLAVNSTSEGFLTPRMTTSQRDAIANPAEGLEIYNLTTHKKNFFNGTSWEQITSA